MLKINIISIGKIKEKYIIDGINEYKKRLSKYINFNIVELPESIDSDNCIDLESDRILKLLDKSRGYNIVLDINGKMLDSIEFSNMISNLSIRHSEINFIIGGSRGVNNKLKNAVDYRLSISKMTFPHQLFRLILTEQIYRAICILNNIKYHK